MISRRQKYAFVSIVIIALISILNVLYAHSRYDVNNEHFQEGNGLYTAAVEPVANQAVSGLSSFEEKKRIVLEKKYSKAGAYANRPVLSQKDFKEKNAIYVIHYDFALTEDITMPENCILDFEGGSLSGGTITGNNTSIRPAAYSIFNDCVIKKFNLPYIDPRWVGAIPDFDEQTKKGTDNSGFFQMAYDNIAENHPGLDIYIEGKYLIAATVMMRMQCNLRGVHNNTRGLVLRNMQHIAGSSSSLIAVGDCPAFRVVGRESEQRTWADLSIEHIKFIGLNKQKSIAIQYEVSGSPTRPASIEKCEASNLLYFLYTKAKEHSTIGNLTISGNNIYGCSKAIYAVSDKKEYMGFTALKIVNNLIEHNGDKCIHLNGCFGPVIIDNNILEGQTNPIYLTNTWGAYTYYVISNNYFEHHSDDDKKIHVDGALSTEDSKTALFLTNVEIYGNTSSYGFEVELNGVVIKRLDRIDTPTKNKLNYSTFKRCLFEDIDLSDVYACQFKDWNFSTTYPTTEHTRNNSLVGESGNDLLSFDDSKGNAHTKSTTKATVSITGDNGSGVNMLITKLRPHITDKNTRIAVRHYYNSRNNEISVAFPREIPYYAFLVYIKDKGLNSKYDLSFNAYNGGTEIEMGSITAYQNVDGQLFNYPYVRLPYVNK